MAKRDAARSERWNRAGRAALLGGFALLASFSATAAWADEENVDYSKFSLEELMSMQLVSASKRLQKLTDTPSAAFVITAEDIRRSGHTTIPEVLRLCPGLQVARQNGGNWAISARGFEDRFANKLLVLVDGRSLYTPLFAGTFWEKEAPALDDVERIEVIRGPGATLWGENAVNGVIHIITRSSTETQGSRMLVRAGNEETFTTELRHGFALSEDLHVRLSGNLRHQDPQVIAGGQQSFDEALVRQLNARADWVTARGDQVRFDGSWYSHTHGLQSRVFPPDYSNSGTQVEADEEGWGTTGGASWKRVLDEHSSIELAGSFDRRSRVFPSSDQVRRTLDVGLQHNLRLAERHQIVWGLNWTRSDSRTDNTPTITIAPDASTLVRYSGFVQDELAVSKDVSLVLGSKVGWNDFTGWEIQPSARGLWRPSDGQQVWAAVSRAVRIPSRLERSGTLVVGVIPFINAPIAISPDPDFESEVLVAWELGYRAQPHERVSIDLALFSHDYSNLGSVTTVPPLRMRDGGHGHSLGAELALVWVPRAWLELSGSFTRVRVDTDTGTQDTTPTHSFQLHGSADVGSGVELDLGFYYDGRRITGSLPARRVSGHSRVDVRLGWAATEALELSLVAQNVLDRRHPEFVFLAPQIEIERSLYAQLVWRF